LKRIFDLLVSITAIVCLSPVFIILYVLIRTKLGSPVLFTQVRPGRYGKLFSIIKFRTMLNTKDENGVLLPDEERMTGFGTWLRNSSLDELPELFNVLKGEMSIVGPRPLLIEYLPLYSKEQSRRHNVRPGITKCYYLG
jgi:lipopolysaccharide/colanic/teichoic acid biosynthesis glycosyltransferase